MTRVFFSLLVAALFVVGCGEEAKSTKQSSPSSTPAAQLEIALSSTEPSSGAGVPPITRSVIMVECPGGPEEACDLLAEKGADLFQPPEGNQACTMQYGGPETAHVEGTVDGEDVEADFSRANGCEIARWEEAAPLWESADGGGSDRSDAAATNLTLTFDAGKFKGMVVQITCPSSDSDQACELLDKEGAMLFAPVARDSACTEIFGGEDVVRVEGTVDGEPVDAILNRSNGCEIARFDAAEPLWSDTLSAG
jgi:hypothetical protein